MLYDLYRNDNTIKTSKIIDRLAKIKIMYDFKQTYEND